MNKISFLLLLCVLGLTTPAAGYSSFTDDNPFVEAMLRMMEIFGLIDRNRLPLGVPYAPGYSQALLPGLGLGGVSGLTGYPGLGTLPGIAPMYGMGAFPGASPIPGAGGIPGISQFPGTGGWPAGGYPSAGGLPGASYWPNAAWPGSPAAAAAYLDGVWELSRGGFVIIRGNSARLYVARDRFQDFTLGYDRQHLWWAPQAGGRSSRYRYQVRDGRMVLRDNEGNYLLLRRRR